MIAPGLVPSVSRHESLKLTSRKLVRQEAATAGEFDIKCMLFDMYSTLNSLKLYSVLYMYN